MTLWRRSSKQLVGNPSAGRERGVRPPVAAHRGRHQPMQPVLTRRRAVLMEGAKPSPTRAAAAYAAAAKVTARLASTSAGDVCVVCLHACSTKACACSYMHEQCAHSYVKWRSSSTCAVCGGGIETGKLSKRPRELDVESEEDARARKRLKEKAAAEQAKNQEWAQSVAPSAALIILRHFTHSRGGATAQAEAQLMGFDAVVLSLCHSGPEYLDDLREDLSHTWPPAEVDSRMRKLHDIADNLSSDGVDEECSATFMRIFSAKITRLPVPPPPGPREVRNGL